MVDHDELKKINNISDKTCKTEQARQGFITSYIEKEDYVFDNELFSASDNSLIIGYWQNEQYFSEFRANILKLFNLKKPLSKFNQYQLELIQAQHTSVSIHIRRGDYAHNKRVLEVHGLCSIEYYTSAINYIEEKFASPYFFIFSDDTNWVEEHFQIKSNYYIIKSSYAAPYEDMFLMTKCEHHIIANSSFSWWGAWLNPSYDKIVIVPIEWLKAKTLLPIICKHWITF